MTTHASILGWRIPWTEEPGGLWSKELDMTEQLSMHVPSEIRVMQQKLSAMVNIMYQTLLNYGVPRYLVKRYSGCVCEGVFWMRLTFKFGRLSNAGCFS